RDWSSDVCSSDLGGGRFLVEITELSRHFQNFFPRFVADAGFAGQRPGHREFGHAGQLGDLLNGHFLPHGSSSRPLVMVSFRKWGAASAWPVPETAGLQRPPSPSYQIRSTRSASLP